jgi:SSS family solute:Na+ symporter
LVPARLDSSTKNPQVDASGHTLLDFDRATPNMLMHFLPTGLLGLGIAALLASLMSGLAASVTAFSAVFTCDLYRACIRKTAPKSNADRHDLSVGRWAAVGAILLSVGVAYAISSLNGSEFNNIFDCLLLVFCLVNAPQLATFLLGMFSKRASGNGAFAGLAAGTALALLHYGLTLPVEAQPGLHGGWIAVAHRYPGFIAECFWTAIFGFAANLIVAWIVSLSTKAAPEEELKGKVHSIAPSPAMQAWWKRTETMAEAILLAAIAVALFFA